MRNKPLQFKQHLDIPIKDKNSKKNRLFLKFLIFTTFVIWSTLAIYGIYVFYNSHEFRTPIIIQSPIIKKEIKIESPIATQSSLMKQVYAETLTPKQYVEKETIKEFGQSHVEAIHTLIMKESSYNLYAMNKTSGACGLFQAYPCSKLLAVCPSLSDTACQINWGIEYIKNRYINPTGALAFWYEKGYY